MKNNFINTIWCRGEKSEYLHIYKQVFATFASCLLFMTSGITFGYTGVLLPQLKDDKDYPYEEYYDSWIASISPLAMMGGCICSGIMTDSLGRKMGQLILIFPFMAGWIVMGFAHSNAVMLAGRFITGFCTGAVRPTTMVYIGEITSPKIRGIALFCPTLAVQIGSLISHVVGAAFYWRTSCIIFSVPNILCFIILLCVTESPLWLISKGKTDKGIQSFKTFRGEGESASKELDLVLENVNNNPDNMIFREKWNVICSKAFFKGLLTVCLLFTSMQLCGVSMISFYAQDIFKTTFNGEIDAYMLMIVTDAIRVITNAAVCLFSRYLPRRMTYLVSSFTTSAVLIGLVVYLLVKPEGLIWLALILVAAFMMIANVLTSTAWPFVAEIFPGNIRGFASGLSSCISFSLLFVSVKITPEIMNSYGAAVMYAFFAIITLIATIFLCFVLPDTTNKSLQAIENSLYKNKKKEVEVTRV